MHSKTKGVKPSEVRITLNERHAGLLADYFLAWAKQDREERERAKVEGREPDPKLLLNTEPVAAGA